MPSSFDIIIVGAGSAGCVLANRLSARSSNRVLLLEAGPDTPPGNEPADVLDTYPMSYYNPAYAWTGLAAHNRRHDNSPANGFRQGRIMGGSSSIMGMVALRGTPDDYDEWATLGAEGWRWDDVLPFFCRLETDINARGPGHGSEGPVPVRRLDRAEWPPFANGVRAWCQNSQIAALDDLNTEFREGLGALPLSRFPDKRASAAICYLDAAVRARPNLTILTDATVDRLTFDGTRATGVVATIGGASQTFTANDVIVSAGALQSPVMLLRHGIGAANDLQAHGVEVRADRPGVGANLQNHACIYIVAQLRRGAAQSEALKSHSIALMRYSSGLADCPSLDMTVSVSSKVGWHALGRRLGTLVPTVIKPASRGRITLGDAGPAGPALIEFDYLSDDRDRLRLAGGVRKAAAMLLAPEMARLWHSAFPVTKTAKMRALNDTTWSNSLRARILAGLFDTLPAAGRPILAGLSDPGLDVAALATDDARLDEFVRNSVAGVMHPVGTCRMGAADDPAAVTDPQGRVHGMAGLRVVDASIMPSLPRANTNIPTIMMAEKISDTMLNSQ